MFALKYQGLYKRIRFSLTLEAQWAAFFDMVEWPWRYNPPIEGCIPSFILDFPSPLLVEAGAFARSGKFPNEWAIPQYVEDQIRSSRWGGDYAVFGQSPVQDGGRTLLGVLCSKDSSYRGDVAVHTCTCCRQWAFHTPRGACCLCGASAAGLALSFERVNVNWREAGIRITERKYRTKHHVL